MQSNQSQSLPFAINLCPTNSYPIRCLLLHPATNDGKNKWKKNQFPIIQRTKGTWRINVSIANIVGIVHPGYFYCISIKKHRHVLTSKLISRCWYWSQGKILRVFVSWKKKKFGLEVPLLLAISNPCSRSIVSFWNRHMVSWHSHWHNKPTFVLTLFRSLSLLQLGAINIQDLSFTNILLELSYCYPINLSSVLKLLAIPLQMVTKWPLLYSLDFILSFIECTDKRCYRLVFFCAKYSPNFHLVDDTKQA